VMGAERGVDASQNRGHLGEARPGSPDSLEGPWVPVGHPGGDQNDVRPRLPLQLLLEELHREAVPPIPTWDVGEEGWFLDEGLQELATAIGVVARPAGQLGMAPVQAVDEGDLVAVLLQHSSDGEQAQGLAPFAVGGEVVDPGVDEEYPTFHCLLRVWVQIGAASSNSRPRSPAPHVALSFIIGVLVEPVQGTSHKVTQRGSTLSLRRTEAPPVKGVWQPPSAGLLAWCLCARLEREPCSQFDIALADCYSNRNLLEG
jgi:hypothetical protein